MNIEPRLLGAFSSAYPEVEVSLLTYDLSQPAAGLLARHLLRVHPR